MPKETIDALEAVEMNEDDAEEEPVSQRIALGKGKKSPTKKVPNGIHKF